MCAYLAAEPVPLELFTRHRDLLPRTAGGGRRGPACLHRDRRRARGLLTGPPYRRRAAPAPPDPGGQPHPPRPTSYLSVGSPPPPARRTAADLMGAPQNWPAWRQFLPHVLAATTHHDDTDTTNSDQTSWLLDRAATCASARPCTARTTPPSPRCARISGTWETVRIDEGTRPPTGCQVAQGCKEVAGWW